MTNESNPNQNRSPAGPGTNAAQSRERARAGARLAAQGNSRRRRYSHRLCGPGHLRHSGRRHHDEVLAKTTTARRAHRDRPAAQAGQRPSTLCASRQRHRLYRLAHLRPNLGLPDPLVLRHRRPRKKGRAPRRNCQPRSRSAIRAGPGRPRTAEATANNAHIRPSAIKDSSLPMPYPARTPTPS